MPHSIQLELGAGVRSLDEAVLFAFDDRCIPFRRDLALHLVTAQKKSPGNIVLPLGKPGDPDERVHFYGTIRPIGDTLHMWYIGRQGIEPSFINREGREGRICHATSKDGVHWEKPRLNLVEFNGNKQNNLVRMQGDPLENSDVVGVAVLHDPGDPDPERRYKMVFQPRGGKIKSHLRVAFSADGLDWTPSKQNPLGPWFEVCGLMKINGCYYVNGQTNFDEQFGPATRKLVTFCSYDFETWSTCPAVGLDRSPGVTGPIWEGQRAKWEEIHIGAGVWDRGSVVLGIYGMWHGHPTGDRRWVSIDLGLAITHDGLHYHEPIPSFPIIPAAEEIDYTPGFPPALMQGQAFANLDEKTCHWYSCWRRDGQVRLATWDRDRLGYLQMFRQRADAEFITCPIQCSRKPPSVFVNADGLGKRSELIVEVLDWQFHPISKFSGKDVIPIRESGLRVPVRWRGGSHLPSSKHPFRLRFRMGGVRPEDIKFYCCYVSHAN